MKLFNTSSTQKWAKATTKQEKTVISNVAKVGKNAFKCNDTYDNDDNV